MRDRNPVSYTFGCQVFPGKSVEEAIFFPLCILDFFVKDQLAVCAYLYVWEFFSFPLIFVSVFQQEPF
jgi:hypothetical protein